MEAVPLPLTTRPAMPFKVIEPPTALSVPRTGAEAASGSVTDRPVICSGVSSDVVGVATGSTFTGASFTATRLTIRVTGALTPRPPSLRR